MTVNRTFKPEVLQPDEIVEILYALLRDSPETLLGADLSEPRPADLLSTPNRGSHVVAITGRKRGGARA
jgi:hypothetical protein